MPFQIVQEIKNLCKKGGNYSILKTEFMDDLRKLNKLFAFA